MISRALAAGIASIALLASGPALAAAQAQGSASKLSLSNSQRVGSPSSRESKLNGGTGGIFALAMVAGIAAILIIDHVIDDDEEPASP